MPAPAYCLGESCADGFGNLVEPRAGERDAELGDEALGGRRQAREALLVEREQRGTGTRVA